jgi:hypothetical protein
MERVHYPHRVEDAEPARRRMAPRRSWPPSLASVRAQITARRRAPSLARGRNPRSGSASLPFTPTAAHSGHRRDRLGSGPNHPDEAALLGDVGSGKTVVVWPRRPSRRGGIRRPSSRRPRSWPNSTRPRPRGSWKAWASRLGFAPRHSPKERDRLRPDSRRARSRSPSGRTRPRAGPAFRSRPSSWSTSAPLRRAPARDAHRADEPRRTSWCSPRRRPPKPAMTLYGDLT